MRARYEDDSSIFLADWQWVNADDVPIIPFPTAFGTSHMDPSEFDEGQIGEVRQTYYPKAGTFLPGFLKGTHYCGTKEIWQGGYPAGYPTPPIIGGVPTCCVDDGAPFDFGYDFGYES